MIIKLNPQRRDNTLTVSKTGDILTINGVAYDFSPLEDGATLPAEAIDCEFIVSPVERIDGQLHLSLLLPHGANPSEEQRFPVDIIDPADGELELPQNVVEEAPNGD
jgi:hypothetical protein